MSGRRGYAIALFALTVAALVAYIAAGATWVTATLDDLAGGTERATGRDLLPVAGALPLLALAGLVGIIATRGRVRAIVGGFLLVAGGVAAVWVLTSGALDDWRADPARASAATEVSAGPIAATTLAALVVAAVGVATMARGSGWPSMGSKYETAARRDRRPSTTPQATWDAIDRGEDPTV